MPVVHDPQKYMDGVSIHRACIKQKNRFGKGQRITDFCCFKKVQVQGTVKYVKDDLKDVNQFIRKNPGANRGILSSSRLRFKSSIQRRSVYPRIPANETFPFSVRPNLACGSFWKLPSDKILQPKLHPKRWPKLGDADQFKPTKLKFAPPPPKENLRLWGGGGNKKCTNSCHGCQKGVFFAGFHAGETTHPWDTPTYLNATATGWFDKLIDLNEKAMRTTAKPTALPSQHQLVTLACKTSSLKMESRRFPKSSLPVAFINSSHPSLNSRRWLFRKKQCHAGFVVLPKHSLLGIFQKRKTALQKCVDFLFPALRFSPSLMFSSL